MSDVTATPPEGSELTHDVDWRRLDTRMLLVHPVNELVRFLPLIIGVFLLGSSNESDPWHYLGVVVPIVIGVVRFASTRFRITPGQIELRRGLLGRSVLTAPLDRVRTVELTASPIHRVLGLAKVEIGTGSGSRNGDNRLVLDSLGAAHARRLRAELLDRAPAVGKDTGPVTQTGTAGAEHVIVRLDPSWIRFAPLTTSGIVIALATLGAGSQLVDNLIERAARSSDLDDRFRALPLAVAIPLAAVSFVVVVSVLAIGGYVLANWGFTLSRDATGRSFHVRRGLLTTRETSIDVDRLRGLEVHEPLGLRLGGGRRLSAVVTGLNRRASESTTLVPAAPRAVVIGVGERILDERSPLTIPLVQHGPQARRRRIMRGVVPLGLVPAALVVLAVVGDLPFWLVLATVPLPLVGLALGLDRYARLGHALTPSYVVVRWGSLRGRRDVLERSGIIGWNIRQSWFQRRAGLVSLTATTAAGQQSYEILDIPEQAAIALADAAVPGLVSQFLR